MRRVTTTFVIGVFVLAACSGTGAGPDDVAGGDSVADTSPPTGRRTVNAVRALKPFAACDELLDWTVDHALGLVGPYGLYGDGFSGSPWALDGEMATTAAVSEADAADPLGQSGVIGTNLQEIGIDEPDLVKTDGRRIVVVTGTTLRVVELDNERLRLAGSIDLGFWSESMFLDRDRVLVIAPSGHYDVMPLAETDIVGPGFASPKVTVTEIDISDPGDPELTRTLQIDGTYVASRMVDGAVRLVVTAQPTGFAWSYPEGGGLRSERIAEEENRDIIRHSTVDNWLPYYVVTDHVGVDRTVAEGTLLECDRAHVPEEFSGLSTLSLVTLDPDELLVDDATAVFADGQIVYSSGDAAYVATSRWLSPVVWETGGPPPDMTTMIHKFGLEARSAEYQASGAVVGYLLNQWSMSEWDGDLRVASTTSPEWWNTPDTESMVTVLRDAGDELEVAGVVDGLGAGERIYAVRMIADRGYVVTFRQVDPLYVLDLSDPERPTVEGELKIPGYSAYLHPVGDGQLLGVGQDADTDGGVFGLQASLFDVSDPAHPDRTDRFTMKDAHTELEWDHHAFLYDPADGLTVVPYQRWDEHGKGPLAGAIVFAVDEGDLHEVGTLSHGVESEWGWEAPIRRALRVDGLLVTVSEAGVMLSSPGSLDTVDWVGFSS